MYLFHDFRSFLFLRKPKKKLNTTATNQSGPWAEVVPRRLKELWSRKGALEDENEGERACFFPR